MSSSIFEVKESESDSEKVLDFGLEENGILSTQVDGEVPKDHTYTKEPDVLQGDVMLDSDNSTAQPEEMGGISSTEKPKSTRSSRNSKVVEKPKPKKAAVTKKGAAAKKAKVTKDDISEEVDAISESTGNGQVEDNSPEAPAVIEDEPKPAKRGRKRKNEEKENTKEDTVAETTNTKETNTKTPKKKTKETVSNPPSAKKGRVKADAEDTVIDTENLPPGWIRKSVTRKSGKTAGQIDVYIFSPDGIKFRSKPDVASYLARTKSNLKLDDFDFSKKKTPIKATVSEKKEPISKKVPKKKAVAEKPKSLGKKKEKPVPPKKSAKLLVKIVSSKPKKSRATKESPAKEIKSPVKGKASKGNKKKTSA